MDSIACLQQIDPAEQQLHGCAPSAFHHVQQPGHKTFAKTTQPRSSYMVGASDEHASPWPARDMGGFFFSPSSYDTVPKNVRDQEVRCILATAL